MEVINRKNKEVIAHRRTSQTAMLTIRDTKTIYLSYAAVSEFGLTAHNYIHFVKDDGKWYFMTNSEPTGFLMYRSHGERWNAGFNIHSVPAISAILAASEAKTKASYRIVKSELLYENRHPLFEILFSSPVRSNI